MLRKVATAAPNRGGHLKEVLYLITFNKYFWGINSWDVGTFSKLGWKGGEPQEA
jgi:hypothetical protein